MSAPTITTGKPATPTVVTPTKTPETRPAWDVSVNRFGDVHFKKAMLASAKQFSGINQGQELCMEFQQGKIIITPKVKKA